jgi:hypothetical protein
MYIIAVELFLLGVGAITQHSEWFDPPSVSAASVRGNAFGLEAVWLQ